MKSEGQKLKLFTLKRILEENTDEHHGLTMQRILELLSMNGVTAERKSIYEDFAALEQLGYEVLSDKHKSTEYRLSGRLFQLSEIKLLIDSIQSSKFLSEAKTREIIKKLESLCSKHEAQTLQRQVVVANRVKSMNISIHYNVDAIHAAISNNSQISFQYFDFDLSKQRKYFKNGAKYTVSPFAMIYADDNYYLLAYDADAGKFKHFRVDKMEKAEATGVDRVGAEEFKKIDMAAYTKYTFSMFGGEIEQVTMVFSNRFIGAVIDRFGRDVVVMKADEKHFKITVSVAVSNQFFGWVFGLGKNVRIVAPESVKEKMKKALEDIHGMYEPTEETPT